MTNSRSRNGIMHLSRFAFALAAAAALAVVPGVRTSADQAPPVNVPGIDKPVIVVTGDVGANETWTSANYYVLRGAVFVRSGSTLNIQAGTRVIGESGSVGTLVVERGGRINAIGTAAAPIVFTSDQPIGQRGRGDWGGIIINGRAPINFGSGEAAGEGDTGVYGGTDPNDNSGILQLRARRVCRHRVQSRQRAERHRFPGRRPRHAGRSRPVAPEPRRCVGVVRRHGGRQVSGHVGRRR